MKNTFRFSNRLFYTKVLISLILVITMITSSLPIAYAEIITDSGKLGNTNFEKGSTSWRKAYGDVKVNEITEGEVTNKALELTADSNAVYQTATRDGNKNYPKGTTFKWSLNYKSADSSDIGALVLGLKEPTATPEKNDQLRQMMTWLRDKRNIHDKVPADGQYTVVVYSKPFNKKENGKFEVDENDPYKDNFSLVPKINCTEKFSVTLFRTTRTGWRTVSTPDNDKFTFNENFPSLYYSLISYSGNPLVDDVDLKIMYDDSVKEEYNNLQNGGFEEPAFTDQYKQCASIPYWESTSTLSSKRFELFRSSSKHHFPSETNNKVDELDQAAELNAEEASTMYQYINTESGSQYKWSLSHRGRYGADIMALIIGPKQKVAPSKTGDRLTEDQFMQIVSWVKLHKDEYPDEKEKIEKIENIQKHNDIRDNDESCDPAKVTVYSKPFAKNGGFVEGTSTNFSATESTVFSEKWDVTIICSGNKSWKKYGKNEEQYSIYNVPEGQDKSIFAFTAYQASNSKASEAESKKNTFGNLLDGVNFELYYPARSISYTGGVADLTYVYKDKPETKHIESGQSTDSLWIDDNSTFTLDVKPLNAVTTVTDADGNVSTVERTDDNGNPIQNAFLGAYITIGGKREYYPATAVDEDQAVYFSETVDDKGMITYSYGKSNVSGRIVVELIYAEVYTMTYNANGGAPYLVTNGKIIKGNMDWSGSNKNVARFYETKSGTYQSTACNWWEINDSVVFKGWQLVGGEIYELPKSEDGTKTLLSDTKEVLFAGNATVEHYVDVDENVFIITDENKKYEGRVDAQTGGVLVANWEYVTSVIAQTEQLNGEFINSSVGGQVALKDCTMHITDDKGTVYTPPADPNNTNNIIDFTDKFTYSSEFNNNITVSGKANEHYTFYGWFDQNGERLSSITDHKYTVEPYYSDIEKSNRKQTPSVIYARFGISTKVRFHINDSETVSTVNNRDADLYRVYYSSTVTIPEESKQVTNGSGITYTLHNLDSNNRIHYFYDIPTPVSTNGKIFMGWYKDPDNDSYKYPIQWDLTEFKGEIDVYAHWIDVGTMNKDAQDSKIIHQSTVGSGLLPGIDLLGVQIRYEDKDDNYPNGRGDGAGQSPHFDTDGLRFITCIKESVLSDAGNLFKTTYTSANEDKTSYTKQPLSYGYVIAKESTVNKAKEQGILKDGDCLEYKGTDVNGDNTTQKYSFVQNVNCTSRNGDFLKDSVVAEDHKKYNDYRIYSLVLTYIKKDRMTDAYVASAKAQNVIARPYLRYQDANGLYRTYYQDYQGTSVYGGCSANYNAAKDFLSKNNYFPPKN